MEAVVARRHRRVRREHDLCGDTRRIASATLDAFGLHPPADQFERRKCAVPFVQVHDTQA